MVNFLLWIVPLLIIPVSFVLYRYVPLRKARYYSYAVILITAFFLNLFQISFWNELIDTIEFILVNFICAEFFWNFLRLKKPRPKGRLFRVLFIVALCVYGFELRHWIIAGPNNAPELWKPVAAGVYRRGGIQYAVREHGLFGSVPPARLLVLTRRIGSLPFEKTIGAYRTPEGFRYADFTYSWSTTSQGVRLDISTAGYRLWTMGEGF